MSISHRTNRLKLFGTPAVEQLQNGRYQLTVNCTTMNSREDWYSANKARIFPDFGSLESAEMSIDGLAPRTGEAYTDMRLVSVQSSTQQDKYIVTLVYQTLGDSFVQVKDDTVNYIENGLRRVTRQSIAKAGTDFQKTVGATSITSQIDGETAVTCVLANYEVNDTDSYREVTEVYIEAGTLSETEDKVGSQLSIVKETFSSTPSTPSGYSVASEQVSNFNGIPTRQFRFLKNNVQLSRAVDNESPLKTEVREYFKPDLSKETLTNYSLVNKQESNVDGIPTERYTFAKNNVTLSETEDKVGGQLAIVKEVFNGTPSTPSGYSIASEQESNVNGIPTKRFTFLKPNILSVTQDFNTGKKVVSVQAFNKTSVEVTSALSEVTSDHKLISQRESDFAGIKTSTFEYQLDESFTEDRELNGLKRIELIELSASNFTAQTIGAVSTLSPTLGLFLGQQDIDNGGTIKVRQSVWLQSGELSRDIRSIGRGVQQTTHQFLVTEGTTTGDVISRDTDNFLGLKRITVSVIARPDGGTLTNADGSAKLSYSEQQLVPFTFPGVVDLQNEAGHIFPTVRSPVQAQVEADVYTYYQASSDIVAGDFTTQSALGLWNPSKWCQKVSTISAAGNTPAYFNAQGLRGCRTRESFTLSGSLQESIATNLQYISLGRSFQISELVLEETTEQENGKSVFRQVIRYTWDITSRIDIQAGLVVYGTGLVASGLFTAEVKWNGSQWVLTATNVVNDPQPSAASDPGGTGSATTVVYSSAANLGTGGYLEGYTNRSGDKGSVSFTASNGGTDPWDATWPSGVTASQSSNEEEFFAASSTSGTFGSTSLAANFAFIEGRVIEQGAVGKIRIFGGPPNPSGKVYTLDVNLEKVFTKLDGTDVYRKTITTATCTPA